MEQKSNEEKVHNPSDEAIVLGLLRKEKSSKPVFVLIVFLVIIGVCLALPMIQEYLKDSTSVIGQLYNKYFGDEAPGEKIVVDNDSLHLFSNNTKIIYDQNLQITNVSYSNEKITYYIKSLNNEINLDETNLYLEVFGSSNNLLRRIKLVGKVANEDVKVDFIFNDFKFNNGIFYYGRIHEMKEDEYPVLNVGANASFKCTKGNESYIYYLKDWKISNIRHELFYPLGENSTIYLNELAYYQGLTDKINSIVIDSASVNETASGLNFIADINLESINKEALAEVYNYNYYENAKDGKIVNYEMKAKGFSCQ